MPSICDFSILRHFFRAGRIDGIFTTYTESAEKVQNFARTYRYRYEMLVCHLGV